MGNSHVINTIVTERAKMTGFIDVEKHPGIVHSRQRNGALSWYRVRLCLTCTYRSRRSRHWRRGTAPIAFAWTSTPMRRSYTSGPSIPKMMRRLGSVTSQQRG